MSMQQKVDFVPSLNAYIKSKINKQEVKLAYSEYVQAFALQATDESSYSGFIKKVLPRLAQYGYHPAGVVRQFVTILASGDQKNARELLRFASYFTQLLLGDGSAGSPTLLPSQYWNNAAPKALDAFDDELLIPCWQHAANDKASINVRYSSLRALAAAAKACQSSRPDDPSLVMALLEAVRVALDQLHGSQQASIALKKGKRRAQLTNTSERSGLQRMVFTAARTGLSRSSVSKIAPACMSGATSPDKLVARHALSMAAVVAIDRPQVCARYLETPLSFNVGLFKQTGSIYLLEGQPVPFQFQTAAPENRPLNLQDPWARAYLARVCGGIVYSNAVRGDIEGVAGMYWQTLVILACTDGSDLVAVEATRAMLGGLNTKSATLRTVGSGNSRLQPRFLTEDHDAQHAALLSRAWRVFTVKGLESSPGQSVLAALGLDTTGEEKKDAQNIDSSARIQAIAMQVDPVLRRLVPKFAPTPQAPVVQKVTQRLLKMLGTHAGLCTACRTVVAIAEARATAYENYQNEDVLGSSPITLAMDVLQERMLAIANEALPPSERVLALEALVWLQLPEHPIIVSPSNMMQMMLRNGQTIPSDLRASVPDPWPADTLSAFLHVLLRRLAVSPGLATYIMECANCVAAVCPSRVHMEQLQLLWDTALKHPNVQVKHAAFKGAMEMLLMQVSPVTQPSSQPIAEVKALAAEEEAGIHLLNRLAALWLGENTAEFPWAATGQTLALQPSTSCPLQEQIALGAAQGNSIIVAVLNNLQLALLTCGWAVKVAAVQAISKIAARCGEPYRIQCYSILSSMQGDGKEVSQVPLGVAGMVSPTLHLLDLVYSTHTVLKQLADKIQAGTMVPLPNMIEAAQSRIDFLHDLVSRRVCFVQKELFRVGPNIAKLHDDDSDDDSDKPDKEDGSSVDSDTDSVVSSPSTTSSTPEEPSSPTLATAPGALMDMLSQFTSNNNEGRGVDSSDDDDESVATSAAGLHRVASEQMGEEDMEELAYPALVLYDFTSNYDEEVSVQKGDKVSVKYELGDWVQVATSDGRQGLVPVDYIQLDGEAEPLQKQYSGAKWPFHDSHQEPAHTAGGTSDNDTDDTSTVADPQRASVDWGQKSSWGDKAEEEDSAAPQFDWFKKPDDGATTSWGYDDNAQENSGWPHKENSSSNNQEYGISYAKEDEDAWTNDPWGLTPSTTSWAPNPPRQSPQASPSTSDRQPYASNPWASSIDTPRANNPPSDWPSESPASPFNATSSPRGSDLAWPPPASAMSPSRYDSGADWPPPPVVKPSSTGDVFTAESPMKTSTSQADERSFISPRFTRTTSGSSSGVASPTNVTQSPSFHRPRRSVEDLPRQPSMSSSSWHAAAAAGGSLSPTSSIAAASTAAPLNAGAEVMYSFQAEADGELSVNPGDKLLVMGEVDGWLQVVRDSDKAVGLVPSDYVQML